MSASRRREQRIVVHLLVGTNCLVRHDDDLHIKLKHHQHPHRHWRPPALSLSRPSQSGHGFIPREPEFDDLLYELTDYGTDILSGFVIHAFVGERAIKRFDKAVVSGLARAVEVDLYLLVIWALGQQTARELAAVIGEQEPLRPTFARAAG